ncbi:MAG: YicC family protein [Candidatus Krumholzibacteriota bacterium]|nr:YicC family protein [Candidatus Krumholzibacteriota bacterium]
MIRSMTGFGSARAVAGPHELQVELRSVNNRFLDLQIRLPRELQWLEGELHELLRPVLNRGRISVQVALECSAAAEPPRVDPTALRAYLTALDEVAREGGLSERGTAAQLLGLPGLFGGEDSGLDRDATRELTLRCLNEALAGLREMKEREGSALEEALRGSLDLIRESLDRIETRLPEVRAALRENLERRLQELMGELPMDEQRLAMEVAVLVDRSDVTEEIVRLASHLGQFGRVLDEGGEVSKKLGFLIQELLREGNTIGSKVQDLAITREVLLIKEEIEKLREQIQNLE